MFRCSYELGMIKDLVGKQVASEALQDHATLTIKEEVLPLEQFVQNVVGLRLASLGSNLANATTVMLIGWEGLSQKDGCAKKPRWLPVF